MGYWLKNHRQYVFNRAVTDWSLDQGEARTPASRPELFRQGVLGVANCFNSADHHSEYRDRAAGLKSAD